MTTQAPQEPMSPWAPPTPVSGPEGWPPPPPAGAGNGRPRWTWLVVGLVVALLLAGVTATVVFLGGDDPSKPATAQRAEVGEPALIAVPGYGYANVELDSEARHSMEAAVADLQALSPELTGPRAPQDVILEQDFSLGAGQFGEWADETSSASIVDGRYRLTASDPGWYAWTYTEFAPKDAVGISARVQSVGALSAGEGPGLVVQRSDQDGHVLDISTEYGAIIAWFHEGVVSFVVGDDLEDVRDFAEAYLQAAHR